MKTCAVNKMGDIHTRHKQVVVLAASVLGECDINMLKDQCSNKAYHQKAKKKINQNTK